MTPNLTQLQANDPPPPTLSLAEPSSPAPASVGPVPRAERLGSIRNFAFYSQGCVRASGSFVCCGSTESPPLTVTMRSSGRAANTQTSREAQGPLGSDAASAGPRVSRRAWIVIGNRPGRT